MMAVYLMVVYRHRQAVRLGGAGGLRHRDAHRPVAVHAGGGARLRRRAGRRSERRRQARRSRARVYKTACAMAAAAMFVMAILCNIAPAALVRLFSNDRAGHRRRRRVPAHHLVELRRLGADLRHLEHVPGDGQHDAVAHRVVQPHPVHRRSRRSSCRRCRASSCAGSGTSRSPRSSCSSASSCRCCAASSGDDWTRCQPRRSRRLRRQPASGLRKRPAVRGAAGRPMRDMSRGVRGTPSPPSPRGRRASTCSPPARWTHVPRRERRRPR